MGDFRRSCDARSATFPIRRGEANRLRCAREGLCRKPYSRSSGRRNVLRGCDIWSGGRSSSPDSCWQKSPRTESPRRAMCLRRRSLCEASRIRTKRRVRLSHPQEFTRSGSTVNRFIAALSPALSFAVKERQFLGRNPVSDIARKKEPRGRTRFLSDVERAKLLEACAKSDWPALRVLVLLAITTGARRGELIALRWSDVDLKAGRALVRETKNGEQRTLPLAGKALEGLRELKLQRSARSEYVFPQPSGAAGPYHHFDSHWYDVLETAGISNFHFHDLRHTTASMLAAQGASLLEIADVLGHKTLAMVKRYSHLVVDHKAKVIEKLVVAKDL